MVGVLASLINQTPSARPTDDESRAGARVRAAASRQLGVGARVLWTGSRSGRRRSAVGVFAGARRERAIRRTFDRKGVAVRCDSKDSTGGDATWSLVARKASSG